MNFYPHHIGDFNNATRHLTRVEQSVYRGAIELYYDTESALTNDLEKLAKRLLCVNSEEKEALKTVLDEFFTQTQKGYEHERCEKEIAKYRANTGAKAKAGIASAQARRQKTTHAQQNSTGVKQNSTPVHNQEPRTINQEPLTKEPLTKNTRRKALAAPSGVSQTVWEDWLDLRAKKKAPVNQTVLTVFTKEAEIAGWPLEKVFTICVANGWQGFKASWVTGKNKSEISTAERDAEVSRLLGFLDADDGMTIDAEVVP